MDLSPLLGQLSRRLLSELRGQSRPAQLELLREAIRRSFADLEAPFSDEYEFAESIGFAFLYPMEISAGRLMDVWHCPGVYSPAIFDHGRAVPLPPASAFQGKHVLEMGAGVGYLAVRAALLGASSVLAVDVSRPAITCIKRNAALYQVSSVVEARQSDLFRGIGPQERFDTIFWNIPWSGGGEDRHDDPDALERAMVDPGRQLLRQFLKESGDFLTAGGAAYLIICILEQGQSSGCIDRHELDQVVLAQGLRSEQVGGRENILVFKIRKGN